MIIPVNDKKVQINLIKKEKNKETRMKLIGCFIENLGKRNINSVAKYFGFSWRYVKKCLNFVKGKLEKKLETRGRKKLIIKYPDLKNDIEKIINDYALTDPDFKTEKRYVRLTVKEIKNRLISTGKYDNKSFSNSYLSDLLNKLGFKLVKVQKIKPLKKIKETDEIFSNVNLRKEVAMKDESTALISIDTKDKVLIGPYSRKGRNRYKVEAVDHELTNNCLVPFGILDLKTDIPYFFCFKGKPTSSDLVDCIEKYYKINCSDKKRLSILLDNGPDNSGVRTTFLRGLIHICKTYKITIELIYYPPYHSKYNPVERLWARLENIWNGSLLTSVEICLSFMKNLTWKGKKSFAKIEEVKYHKGLKVNKKDMKILENKHISRSSKLKKWSIIITP